MVKRILIFLVLLASSQFAISQQTTREYWLDILLNMCNPIFENLSNGTLKQNMPVETIGSIENLEERRKVTHLEAVGRSFAGLAPWLNLPANNTKEGKLRKNWQMMVIKAISNAVDSASADHLSFDGPGGQPLVDAAYFAEGLLRSKDQIWPRLSKKTQERIIMHLKSSRKIKAMEKNWLMFAAIREAALLEFTGDYDAYHINHAIERHEEWYKGDGWYGDGKRLHFDYYNSYVIHPMLVDVLTVLHNKGIENPLYNKEMIRFRRMAEQQERLINADGTFPAIGRSICYRTGAFHLLGQAALMHQLTKHLRPAQVRCALTAMYKKVFVPETFDKDHWLVLGLCGHQPQLADKYVSTGSLYMATLSFLPLGLPEDDPFWSTKDEDWSSKKIWAQDRNVVKDEALRD